MKNLNRIVIPSIIVFLLLTFIISTFLREKNAPETIAPESQKSESAPDPQIPPTLPPENDIILDEKSLDANLAPNPSEMIELTSGNFESFVVKCFQGIPCKLGQDPWQMYRDFKTAGNRQAMDNLISFLRSKLRTPALRESYRKVVRDMIIDFYPANERQFQEAAYYSYLEDHQKSLNLYLDLDKKAISDPNLKTPSRLNIANEFWDMGRKRESLPYYQTALANALSGKEKYMAPSTPEMIHFLEERIQAIRTLNESH